MAATIEQRARVHAALGEPHRLAIVEELATSDRTSSELGRLLAIPSNLLAHHLDALADADLIERLASTGDRRRRYVRLRREPLTELVPAATHPAGPVLFVCTNNSARSPLAAALWQARTGGPAASAGTHPAARVHPGAVAAAGRAGLDLAGAAPARLTDDDADGASLVVTVCDQAHEELAPPPSWWHWSIPDPVTAGTGEAFDAVVGHLEHRIGAMTVGDGPPPSTGPTGVGSTDDRRSGRRGR